MNVKKAELYKIALPLKEPFRTGFGELSDREIVFIKLFDSDGLVGIGESANMALPFYEPDFNDSTLLLLKNFLIPQILNKQLNTIDDLERSYASIRGNNFAKAAIEAAFWHIVSQKENKPLRTLWGGEKTEIPAAISIGLANNLQESISKVLRYIDTFKPRRAKIKIKPGIDIALIKEVRKAYPDLPIFVDANASYTIKDIIILKALDEYNLLMIEQPFQYNDIVDHSILQKELKTPICLDESISNYHIAEQALEIKACRIINIKPQRLGGYYQAKKVAELAQKHNVPVWCGGMIESGWGQLFNCSLATLPNFTYENDICLTKWYLADDILETEIKEKNGIIDVTKTDNQFVINEEKFKKYTTYNENIS